MFNFLFKRKSSSQSAKFDYSELLSGPEFNGILQDEFDKHLGISCFVSYKIGKWVMFGKNNIRYVFEIRHFKGAVSAPEWGVSLDYVPHMNSDFTKIYWHRTDKSARLDVFPFYSFDSRFDFSRFTSFEAHKSKVMELAPDIVAAAMTWYRQINTPTDLLPIFHAAQNTANKGLGYWNYVQFPLAYAFTLKITGDVELGKRALHEFIEKYKLNTIVSEQLVKRFETAKA